jgi:RHS repeat-associated protein
VVANGSAETTWYVYDGSGTRTRKITERQNGTRKDERIYLGCFEAFLVYDGSGDIDAKRETLHVMDDAQRIAMVETKVPAGTGTGEQLVRYQFGNHLGSASLELDEHASVVTYEEYFPYGGTSYQAVRGGLDANPKRYRFTAMERDDQTGFSYHAARYYAPWLCRWTSPDPASIEFGVMVYGYASENPITFSDPTGLKPDKKFQPPKRPPLKKAPTKKAPDKKKAPVKKAPAKKEPAKKEPVKKDEDKNKEPEKEKAPAGTTPAPATPAKMTEAQKKFRADHSGFKPEQLDNIDRALAKISADNPGLSEAFYIFYTGRNFTDDLDPATGKFGDTQGPGNFKVFGTKILKDVVDLKPPKGSTDNAEALLGGTLIHELSHGPYAVAGGALGGPTEGKGYGIESFFAGRMKDKTRETMVGTLGPKYGDREAYDSAEYLMTQLYNVIDGKPINPLLKDVTVKQAQDLVLEFITKNGDQMSKDTRTLFTAILKDGSSTYSKRSWGSLP